MDRLELYREAIKSLLQQYAESMSKGNTGLNAGIETQLVFDTENDRYLLLDIGWQKSQRIHHCIFHLDIKEDKIWLQENNTDIEIDRDLEELGISKQEIVVGFHHPALREYSDYAIA